MSTYAPQIATTTFLMFMPGTLPPPPSFLFHTQLRTTMSQPIFVLALLVQISVTPIVEFQVFRQKSSFFYFFCNGRACFVHVCIFVYIHTLMHMYKWQYKDVYVKVWLPLLLSRAQYMYTFTYAYLCMCVHAHKHVHAYRCVYSMYIHAYVYIYLLLYIYIYIYIY